MLPVETGGLVRYGMEAPPTVSPPMYTYLLVGPCGRVVREGVSRRGKHLREVRQQLIRWVWSGWLECLVGLGGPRLDVWSLDRCIRNRKNGTYSTCPPPNTKHGTHLEPRPPAVLAEGDLHPVLVVAVCPLHVHPGRRRPAPLIGELRSVGRQVAPGRLRWAVLGLLW